MKIAVSSCLLGIPCRFDGTGKPCADVIKLKERHELIPLCPEQLGGMSVPHPPCEVDASSRSLCVIDQAGVDWTDQFCIGARRMLEICQREGVQLAILKERSPSCATEYLYDGTFSERLVPGNGIAARLLCKNGIRTIGESRLADCTDAIFSVDARTTPTLHTDRFTLRPLGIDDAESVFEYSKDPDVGIDAGWEPHRTVDDSLVFIERIASSPHVFGLVEKDTGRIVGSIGLIKDTLRSNPDCLMLGYALGQEWWGKGYMTEAAREVIRYGFEDLRLSLITATHYEFNRRSRRVIEKCGFQREGVLRAVELAPDGVMQDLVCYSMTKQEYFAQGLDELSERAREGASSEEEDKNGHDA
jgi:uncharacterized protein YbbK (DUF523 family)/RimJ/RimL family protein N-acetyltransferase